MQHKTFWMVKGGAGPATFVHHDVQSARMEAERLAQQNPGTTFYLMEAVAACVRREVTWESCDPNADLPF